MHRWLKIFGAAAKSWIGDNGFKHSAAVSYYTLFSMAPITIIALAIVGFVFGEAAARGQFTAQMTQLIGRQGAEALQRAVALSEPQKSGWMSAGIGIALLLIGATTVVGQLRDSLNEIWSVTTRPDRNVIWNLLAKRLISFAMVVSVGLLLLISLLLTTALTSVVHHFGTAWSPYILGGADFVGGLFVISVLFALVFKVLPDVQLAWTDVWRGAVITALLFDVGRFLIALYLSYTSVASTFGAAGSLVALLVWVYYSSAILFFGVEVTRAQVTATGRPLRPTPNAVQVRRELLL